MLEDSKVKVEDIVYKLEKVKKVKNRLESNLGIEEEEFNWDLTEKEKDNLRGCGKLRPDKMSAEIN